MKFVVIFSLTRNSLKMITCIDVGGTFIKAGNVSKGRIKDEMRVDTGDPSILKDVLCKLIIKMGGSAVGIAIAGLVEKDGSISKSPNLKGLKPFPLGKLIQDKLNLPVFVDNDANLAALGEYKYGAGRGVKNLIMLTLGTGVGGGIIIDGRIYHGRGYAGEVGHITMDPYGPLCGCGNYGCLEGYIGAEKLTERAESYLRMGVKTTLGKYKGKITPKIIEDEAYKGDRIAVDIIDEMAGFLGIAISNYCAVLDPERVIIGGGLSKMGDILLSGVKREVKKRLYSRGDVEIVLGELGEGAALLGAYEMVISLQRKE